MRFEVILLEPAAKFIEGLGAKLGAKVLRTLELLQHFGSQLPMPHARKLEGEDLYKLRVRQSTNIMQVILLPFQQEDVCRDLRLCQEEPENQSTRDPAGCFASRALHVRR